MRAIVRAMPVRSIGRPQEGAHAPPTLRLGQVHLWRAIWRAEWTAMHRERGPGTADALSAAERRRAETFPAEAARRQFVLCRTWLRAVLGAYLGCPPAAVPLVLGKFGKPRLAGASGLTFSLAHSETCAVLAVTRGSWELGIDLERMRPIPWAAEIVAHDFTAREWARWTALARSATGLAPLAFVRWWTAKEAYLKAIGVGLHGGLDGIDVADMPIDGPDIWRPARAGEVFWWRVHGHSPRGQHLLVFDPFPGSRYAGALVIADATAPHDADPASKAAVRSSSVAGGVGAPVLAVVNAQW